MQEERDGSRKKEDIKKIAWKEGKRKVKEEIKINLEVCTMQ
jgi:hypothetical protein